MKKLFNSVYILIIFLAGGSISFAFEPHDDNLKIKKIFNYVEMHKDYFNKNKINPTFELYNNNRRVDLDKYKKCDIKCKHNFKFDRIVFYSQNAINATALENVLASYFNKNTEVKAKSKPFFSWVLLALLITATVLVCFPILLRKRKKNKIKETNLHDLEVTNLIQDNLALEEQIDGMLHLLKHSQDEYNTLRKRHKLTQRLPDSLKNRLLDYELKKLNKKSRSRVNKSSINLR